MKYAYRIMMTELCEIPPLVQIQPGCTQGFSENPELMDEILYDSAQEAAIELEHYRSIATGIVMDWNMRKVRGVREFYIEKIKVGQNDRKLLSYGAVKYAEFQLYGKDIPSICPEPPAPIKRRRRRKQTA